MIYINSTLSCFCDNKYDELGMNAAFKLYASDGIDYTNYDLYQGNHNKDETGD